MIKSFSALAAGGGADSAALSAGISEALINTAFGIATSWCAVVSYGYYSNKVDKLTFALDEVGYSIAQTYEVNTPERTSARAGLFRPTRALSNVRHTCRKTRQHINRHAPKSGKRD